MGSSAIAKTNRSPQLLPLQSGLPERPFLVLEGPERHCQFLFMSQMIYTAELFPLLYSNLIIDRSSIPSTRTQADRVGNGYIEDGEDEENDDPAMHGD